MTYACSFWLLTAVVLQGTLSNADKNPFDKLVQDLGLTELISQLGSVFAGLSLEPPKLASGGRFAKTSTVEDLDRLISSPSIGNAEKFAKHEQAGVERILDGDRRSANPVFGNIAEPAKDARKKAESVGRSIDRAAMPGGRFPIPQDPFRGGPSSRSGSGARFVPEVELSESGVKLTVRVPSDGDAPNQAASVVKDPGSGVNWVGGLGFSDSDDIRKAITGGAVRPDIAQPGDAQNKASAAAKAAGKTVSGTGIGVGPSIDVGSNTGIDNTPVELASSAVEVRTGVKK